MNKIKNVTFFNNSVNADLTVLIEKLKVLGIKLTIKKTPDITKILILDYTLDFSKYKTEGTIIPQNDIEYIILRNLKSGNLTENGLIAGMKDLQMFYKSFITNILHCNEDMQLFNEEDKD